MQWLSLTLLFFGVALTQITTVTDAEPKNSKTSNQNALFGFGSVVLACICSGFAGVFFEKLLKGSAKSVALRNIQLAFYGVTAGFITAWLKEGRDISEKGFFFGYDFVVWAAILIQSLGGLLIAATIKYADNILKGFATSVAIVLTFVLSIFIFDFKPTLFFYIGSIFVVTSTLLYSIFSNRTPPNDDTKVRV